MTDTADRTTSELRREVDQLRQALTNRDVIGMAKGILIAERRCAPDEAFAVLVTMSQTSNRKLVDICQELVRSHGPATSKVDDATT